MNESGVSGVVFLDISLDIDLVDQVFFHLFLNHLFITESNTFYSMALTPMKTQYRFVYHKVLSWDLFILVFLSSFFNDLPLHENNISVDCDMLVDDTTLHTSEKKDILQIRSQLRSGIQLV